MTSKNTKSGKKDDSAAGLTVEAVSTLLDQHREALVVEFKSSFSLLETKLNQIQCKVEDHSQRLPSLELTMDNLSQSISELGNICSSLPENNIKLMAKVTDLEGWSRWQNLRMLGLPESIEGRRPTEFFSSLLCEIFGKETLPSPLEIGRAHRSLAAKPAPGQKLHLVTLRLHRYQIKDLLFREARRRRKLEYHGQQIRVVEDYSPEVLSLRPEYREVMMELYNRELRPSLLYPARLRITLPSSDKKWLHSVDETRIYIDSLPTTSNSS
ncbi:cAMP responsive element modulator b [Mobula hypostoma]|uniref:cAMP responsive element modulator b n=1 Tax=Mobula hypostoma TaxID=723540 RepID=UPI002FC2CD3F